MGNTDPTPPWIPFTVNTSAPDVAPPDGFVDIPENGEEFTVSDVVLSGTATDDVGVTKVKVAVRNTVDKTWLQSDGVTFGSSYASSLALLGTPGGMLTDWSFAVSLPDGAYALEIKAVDAVGNTDPTPPWIPFTVNTS